MRHLVPRQRRALAFFIAFSVTMVGAALANTPEGGFQPGVTINVTPSDNLTNNQAVTVTGSGFGANRQVDLVMCDNSNPQRCSDPLNANPINTDANGNFTTMVNVPSSYVATTVQGNPTVNCLVTQCFVQANNFSGQLAQHHVNFSGGVTTVTSPTSSTTPTSTVTTTPTSSTSPTTTPTSSTSPTTVTTVPTTVTTVPTTVTTVPTTVTTVPTTVTTVPTTVTTVPTTVTTVPTTVTTVPTTVTTVPTTVTTVPTTVTTTVTTVPTTVTTVPGSICAQLLQTRANVNAQINAAEAVVRQQFTGSQRDAVIAQLETTRAQSNNQINQALVAAGCPTA